MLPGIVAVGIGRRSLLVPLQREIGDIIGGGRIFDQRDGTANDFPSLRQVMRFEPELSRDGQGFDRMLCPPSPLGSAAMKFIMVEGTEGDGELITHLHGKTAPLGKGEMMGMGGRPAADEAGIGGNEHEMGLVA